MKKVERYWLMKTEPDVFSFEDLVRAKNRTTHWEGVRNYQARNFLRDQFQLGDLALIYHSNVEEPVIAGIAEVVRAGYPDDEALNPKSPYFDEKAAKKGENPWFRVDVKAISRFREPLTRARLQQIADLKEMVLLQRGSRLSIQPVTAAEFKKILKLGNALPL